MKIGVGLGRDGPDDWASAVRFVTEAERLGVDSIWSAETWGFDGATPLAYVAGQTSRVRLGTSILQIGARTPALTAMTAMALASMTGDRFVLGLGVSGPQIIEGWHGVPFDHPVQRTRELIEVIRLVEARERLVYHGRFHHIPLGDTRPMRSAVPPRRLPIHLAALGPANLRLTGELADGWIGNCFIPESAEVYLGPLRASAERAGRTLRDIELQVPVTLEFDDDLEAVAKRHAEGYAFTFGAMGTPGNNFYVAAFSRQGFADEVHEVERLWLNGQIDEARARVPLDIAVNSNLLGTEETIKERLRAYRDAGIDALRVGLRGENAEERLEQLERLMGLVAEVDAESTRPV